MWLAKSKLCRSSILATTVATVVLDSYLSFPPSSSMYYVVVDDYLFFASQIHDENEIIGNAVQCRHSPSQWMEISAIKAPPLLLSTTQQPRAAFGIYCYIPRPSLAWTTRGDSSC